MATLAPGRGGGLNNRYVSNRAMGGPNLGGLARAPSMRGNLTGGSGSGRGGSLTRGPSVRGSSLSRGASIRGSAMGGGGRGGTLTRGASIRGSAMGGGGRGGASLRSHLNRGSSMAMRGGGSLTRGASVRSSLSKGSASSTSTPPGAMSTGPSRRSLQSMRSVRSMRSVSSGSGGAQGRTHIADVIGEDELHSHQRMYPSTGASVSRRNLSITDHNDKSEERRRQFTRNPSDIAESLAGFSTQSSRRSVTFADSNHTTKSADSESGPSSDQVGWGVLGMAQNLMGQSEAGGLGSTVAGFGNNVASVATTATKSFPKLPRTGSLFSSEYSSTGETTSTGGSNQRPSPKQQMSRKKSFFSLSLEDEKATEDFRSRNITKAIENTTRKQNKELKKQRSVYQFGGSTPKAQPKKKKTTGITLVSTPFDFDSPLQDTLMKSTHGTTDTSISSPDEGGQKKRRSFISVDDEKTEEERIWDAIEDVLHEQSLSDASDTDEGDTDSDVSSQQPEKKEVIFRETSIRRVQFDESSKPGQSSRPSSTTSSQVMPQPSILRNKSGLSQSTGTDTKGSSEAPAGKAGRLSRAVSSRGFLVSSSPSPWNKNKNDDDKSKGDEDVKILNRLPSGLNRFPSKVTFAENNESVFGSSVLTDDKFLSSNSTFDKKNSVKSKLGQTGQSERSFFMGQFDDSGESSQFNTKEGDFSKIAGDDYSTSESGNVSANLSMALTALDGFEQFDPDRMDPYDQFLRSRQDTEPEKNPISTSATSSPFENSSGEENSDDDWNQRSSFQPRNNYSREQSFAPSLAQTIEEVSESELNASGLSINWDATTNPSRRQSSSTSASTTTSDASVPSLEEIAKNDNQYSDSLSFNWDTPEQSVRSVTSLPSLKSMGADENATKPPKSKKVHKSKKVGFLDMQSMDSSSSPMPSLDDATESDLEDSVESEMNSSMSSASTVRSVIRSYFDNMVINFEKNCRFDSDEEETESSDERFAAVAPDPKPRRMQRQQSTVHDFFAF